MGLLASEIGYDNRAAVSLLETSGVQPPPLQVSSGAERVCVLQEISSSEMNVGLCITENLLIKRGLSNF